MPASPEDPRDTARPSKADIALEQAMVVLAPLVRWLLRSGVNWVSLSQALKPVFLQEGRRELLRTGGKMTDSALSVLSGVHRKDVRALEGVEPARGVFAASPASRVVARWLADPACHAGGRLSEPPLERLPRQGPAPSFEALARQVSSDVHPHTLLDEMVRLGMARVEGDQVALALDQFTPDPGHQGAMAVAAANTADHLAAAVHNLTTTQGPRFLEQSVFATGLTGESTAELARLARELWRPALQSMVEAAGARVQADRQADAAPMRMRFGIYYYDEDRQEHNGEDRPGQTAPAQAKPAARPRRRPTRPESD
jgi:hypothetical protein